MAAKIEYKKKTHNLYKIPMPILVNKLQYSFILLKIAILKIVLAGLIFALVRRMAYKTVSAELKQYYFFKGTIMFFNRLQLSCAGCFIKLPDLNTEYKFIRVVNPDITKTALQ
jgi:hypothetical protein